MRDCAGTVTPIHGLSLYGREFAGQRMKVTEAGEPCSAALIHSHTS